jgi:hypothetical protein
MVTRQQVLDAAHASLAAWSSHDPQLVPDRTGGIREAGGPSPRGVERLLSGAVVHPATSAPLREGAAHAPMTH